MNKNKLIYSNLPTKGKGLNKKQFYSFCSIHYTPDENCQICKTGSWKNVYKQYISSFIFDHFPKFWIWIANH